MGSEPIHLVAWMQLLDEMGLPKDANRVRASVGRTAPEILASLLDEHRPGWTHEQYDLLALAQRKNDFYVARAVSELQIYPGVEDGIRWLKSQEVKIAVVSNARRRELERTMKALGLFPYFDAVVSRDDAGAAKPDPTPYLFAAELLGVAPSECVAIEDSPTGLEAALMAKIPGAGVTTNFAPDDLRAPVLGRPDLKATWVGPSMVEFFNWLKAEMQ